MGRSVLTRNITEEWTLGTYQCKMAAYALLKSGSMYKQITNSYQFK